MRLPKWSADTSERRPKGGDVEIRKILVLYAEEVKVSGINAQLTVGAAEILLEEKASRAFLEDDRDKSVSAGQQQQSLFTLFW